MRDGCKVLEEKEWNVEHICIDMYFEWSAWTSWSVLEAFKKHQACGPLPAQSGVYEIRRTDAEPEARLSIGSSKKLTTRLYDGLMNDQGGKNATHKKHLFLQEVQGQTDLLALRWATTDEYMALERYLHRQYLLRFGTLPTYVFR